MRLRAATKLAAGLVVGVLLGACEDEYGPNVSGVPGFDIRWVEVTPGVDTVFVSDTIRASDRLVLQAAAYGVGSQRLPVGRFVWGTSDSSIAVVDSFGVVTPRRFGTVEISASATRIGKATVVVAPATRRVEVVPLAAITADTIFVDDPSLTQSDVLQLRATAFDEANRPVTGVRFLWQSATPTVVTVDSAGLVQATGHGSSTISVTGNGTTGTLVVRVRPRTERAAIFGVALGDPYFLAEVPRIDTIFVDDPIAAPRDVRLRAARAFDRTNRQISPQDVRARWSSSAPSVVRVDSVPAPLGNPLEPSTITATALSLGSATVTLQIGPTTSTTRIDVVPVVRNVSVATPAPQVLAGDTLQLQATSFNFSGQPISRSYRWSSSNPAVATVDNNGRAIFVATGSATFTATTAFRSNTVSVTALPRELTAISSGIDFTCGIARLGRIYCWGLGSSGQVARLADSSCAGDPIRPFGGCVIQPARSAEPYSVFTSLTASDAGGCALREGGLIYCWGNGGSGQIGNGSFSGTNAPSPATVLSERFAEIVGGGQHYCALNTQGYAYCWGSDDFGQLGDTSRVNSSTPIPVVGPDGLMASRLRFTSIAAGRSHTCAIEAGSGAAWCWGQGASGQRGDGTTEVRERPRRVLSDERFRQISADSSHTCAVTESNALYCWGGNAFGQLGVGGTAQRNTPTLVGSGYSQVAAGASFTCALTVGGSINCWGNNQYGQLGRGEGTPTGFRDTPAPISIARSYRSVTAGARHACAIDSESQTWCWGSNIFGALGNGLQAAMRAVPERIAPLR
ncbi:MAG: hypothetical protein C0516_13830 [Gemmatimonas sp.]|nr:hypothetical protein [Gemmatimonas sp.]